MRSLVLLLGIVGALEAAGPRPAAAQPAAPAQLEVPYLSQTEALCGGAAVAMVFRYWGDRYADVQQFAPLVDRTAGGIAQQALVGAVRERGWTVAAFQTDLAALQAQLSAAQPLVLLIEDRPGRFHYVVATGADNDHVVVHDPARGPSRRFTSEGLLRAWRPTGFWAMRIAPGPEGIPPPASRTAPAVTTAPAMTRCDRLLEAALDQVAARGLAAADETLGRVRESCPGDSRPVSELAGVRFAARRWAEAAALAEEAAVLDAGDAYAWDVLGSSRFMLNDTGGALRAWNEVHKPRLDRVAVTGLARTRHALVVEALGLASTTMLTADSYRLAERRLQMLPNRVASRIALRPDAAGFAVVDVAVTERSGLPGGAVQWGAEAARALIGREITASIPGRSGQGEVWSASWRWWEKRPRIELAFSAPAAGGPLPGVWRVEGAWEAQAYRDAGAVLQERRLHAGIAHTNWWTPDLRYEISAGVDSWNRAFRTGSLGALVERRALDDRLALIGSARTWRGAGAAARFHTADAAVRFRSRVADEGVVIRGAAGFAAASVHAPRALWPGAGTGQARPMLLRAHPLLADGVIQGPAFGRTLQFATAEAARWFSRPALLRLAVAGFVDAARARRQQTHVDAGAGVRVRVPGIDGTLRADIARGIRDGAWAFTAAMSVD